MRIKMMLPIHKTFIMTAIKKTVLTLLALSVGTIASLPALAATTLLAASVKPQPVPTPRVIYQGRVKPEPLPSPYHRQVLGESPGYHRQGAYPRHRRSESQRPTIAARLYYQAPSSTVINRQVQVIAPQNATSDTYFNQDTYYLYPSSSLSYHPARRYYPPVSRVTIDPQDTENRAKQWTDRTDFNR